MFGNQKFGQNKNYEIKIKYKNKHLSEKYVFTRALQGPDRLNPIRNLSDWDGLDQKFTSGSSRRTLLEVH